MHFTRDEHIQFLQDELRAQTEAFRQKMDISAVNLLVDKETLFVAQFLKFEEGEMILKFSNNRLLPRQGEYLYCFSVPKELRDYRNWGNRTYGDLIKEKYNYSEVVCLWQTSTDDKDYSIAGFRGIDIEFASDIQEAEGRILILGPNKPPFEYLTNLQKIVKRTDNEAVNKILDQDFQFADWTPYLLDNKRNIPDFIFNQLELQDKLIIQGPPGTGKTYLMAEICARLCNEGKSVLVTALTNRALIEMIEKPALKNLLSEHKIFKTKLSVDEVKANKDLQQTKEISPLPGKLILSTFYITSGEASQVSNIPPFDYVIVDEASQALLAMFAGGCLLGKKNIWIGDTKQLPPIVTLGEDKVNRKNYGALVDGLKALSDNTVLPIFQLTESYRLTERATNYSGFFYRDSLKSKSKKNIRLNFPELVEGPGKYLHPKGGPTLIKIPLPIGDLKPSGGLQMVTELVMHLLDINEDLHISVLCKFTETTRGLQKHIFQAVGYPKNILVDTVEKVQGLTTDICIYFIPNTSYHRSLDCRLFNVATSRSKRHTIIIADKSILIRNKFDHEVNFFLRKLNEDFSFEFKNGKEIKLLG